MDPKKHVDLIEAEEARVMNIQAECYAEIMEKHFSIRKGLGLTEAGSKEAFYGFHCNDVARVHFHRQGVGAGVFFRLRDGRVIDIAAQLHPENPIWYDQTTH